MGATKNIVRGVIFSTIYVLSTIVIPLFTFTVIFSIKGLPFQWEQQDFQNITFWITAFGLLISGLAFFTFSSPKHSIRRGVFALIQVIVNCLYLWSYKFSGAAEINFIIADFGFFTLNVQQMILTYMGIYFLTIVLKVYDIIDFTINREKIREKRMKK
ncbi:hypothetical protein LCGC14_0865070 [marine sediment metagenome]|uniref:Uncharacterized protein n=1 Tax=marine sediment metagenome TaxID=412755 RepID=A0A0F9P6B6_9ZZZZ|nr:MAG: hypothetical protein Lokiarch_43550 [Candidatus Lokiarchaeum sp. GC14_75]